MENKFDYSAPSLKHLKQVELQDGLQLVVLNKDGGKAVINFTPTLEKLNTIDSRLIDMETSFKTIATNLNILGKSIENYKLDIDSMSSDVDLYINKTEELIKLTDTLKLEIAKYGKEFKNKSISKSVLDIKELKEGEMGYIDNEVYVKTINGLKKLKYDV